VAAGATTCFEHSNQDSNFYYFIGFFQDLLEEDWHLPSELQELCLHLRGVLKIKLIAPTLPLSSTKTIQLQMGKSSSKLLTGNCGKC
jgi:hypothetical protein